MTERLLNLTAFPNGDSGDPAWDIIEDGQVTGRVRRDQDYGFLLDVLTGPTVALPVTDVANALQLARAWLSGYQHDRG